MGSPPRAQPPPPPTTKWRDLGRCDDQPQRRTSPPSQALPALQFLLRWVELCNLEPPHRPPTKLCASSSSFPLTNSAPPDAHPQPHPPYSGPAAPSAPQLEEPNREGPQAKFSSENRCPQQLADRQLLARQDSEPGIPLAPLQELGRSASRETCSCQRSQEASADRDVLPAAAVLALGGAQGPGGHALKPGGEGLGAVQRRHRRDSDAGQGGHPCSWPTELRGQETLSGTSLVVQGVRLHAPSARGLSLVPAQGTRSPTPPQRKVLHVAVKISHVLPLRPGAARKRKRPLTSQSGRLMLARRGLCNSPAGPQT